MHQVQSRGQHNGLVVVGDLPFWLRIYADEIESLPNVFQKFVHVPLVPGRDHAIVGNFVQNVKLLDGYFIDAVHYVDTRYVFAVALNDIDKIIHSPIIPKHYVSVVNFVF